MKVPPGFRFAGVHAGLKPARKDLALVFADGPCAAAGCFTRNLARAAPVLDAQARLPAGGVRALLVNSGHANALTGPQGLLDVSALKSALAAALKLSPDAVLTASTGVIGHRLPVAKVTAALPGLVQGLRAEGELFAEAILTTDTRIKVETRQVRVGGRDVTVAGIAKGSGMIHPSLATVLGVVLTDAAVTPPMLQQALAAAMGASFNALTVDGDMSTNDAVFALANGRAGHPPIESPGEDYDAFAGAVAAVCQSLARQVASDGEGATKLLTVEVAGAPTAAAAAELSRAVAGSTLVKAAAFGADPNWGRILSAIGARAGERGLPVDPHKARVEVQGVLVYDGAPVAFDAPALKAHMREPEIRVAVDLRGGAGRGQAWGCDLSYDYVKLNADYTSLLVQTPEGGVARDNRLTNYSPAFKASLLVEALSYISRFAKKRCVVKYGGEAMVKDSLKKSFCDDINLLRSLGLVPVVVHGGGPDITRVLERLGKKSHFVDGHRVTGPEDLEVVEMVLSGSINSELVTLMNHDGGAAVGVSGKDGSLLRARKLLADDGQDLGQVGEVTRVNTAFLEMLLAQGYVPIISPIGIGEDGQTYNLNADAVAAEVAIALCASKLIYLSDVPGLLRSGELVPDLTAPELSTQLAEGAIGGGMKLRVQSVLRALTGGVERVHLIDGRVPHSLIAELFTDRGVGTLVTRP